MSLPQRKTIRLREYDYGTPGYYFVTVCTHNRQSVFGRITDGANGSVGGDLRVAPPMVELSNIGAMVERTLCDLTRYIPTARVDTHCVMPDHIHMIIELTGGHGGPPLHAVVGRIKSYTQHLYQKGGAAFGTKLWQRGYYEHIVRNEQELNEIRQYIQNNPLAEVIL